MVPIQLINSVIEWERRLEYEEERRKYHRSEPYVNYLAAPQPSRKDNFEKTMSWMIGSFILNVRYKEN